MKKKRIRIDFCDFHWCYNKADNFFFNLLKERFDVVLSDQPDFLIYSSYGHEHRLHSGVRIFASWESGAPDYAECDYSISCLKVDDARHLQLPYYVHHGDPAALVKSGDDPAKIFATKTKFCSFVVSNHHPRKNRNRVEFFHRLSKYKRVDSGGRLLNNIGGAIAGAVDDKLKFLANYKFNIAFENASIPGYTTEKIFEAMQTRCLPIYWGNPEIAQEFNPKSFLNYVDFPNEEALIERIIELDQDDSKYLAYLREPYFHNDKPNQFFNRERILDYFEAIFSTPIRPVAQRKKWFSLGRWKLVRRHPDRSLWP